MRLTKSFTASDLKEDQKIIVYGAGRYGELAFRGLEYLKLRPAFFADKALAGSTYMGIEVIDPGELVKYKNDVVLIASFNYFYEMLSMVQTMGNEYYDILKLIQLEYDESVLSEYTLDEKRNYQKYANVVENAGIDGLVLPHCEIVLTERCTLRCKDCANLMQYYSCPENLETEEILRDFEKFLASVDLLLEVRLLGGEPFICKDIDQIIKYLLMHEKVKRVTIYTNCTVMPSEEVMGHLKDCRLSVHMSDYGAVSSKIRAMKEAFDQRGIPYYIHKYDKWYDVGNLDKRNYTEDVKRQLYGNCLMSKCYTFYRGRFYLCPRAAHGERIGAFRNSSGEVVDFTGTDLDSRKKRAELKTLLENTTSITACDYCNGCSSRSKEVDAAVQMKRGK